MNTDTYNDNRKPTKRNRSFWRFVAILVLVALVAAGAFYYFSTHGGASADAEVVASVGKHIMLADETPTITTVEQTADLASQPFFRGVKTGDKILIYPEAARIIIYRPSDNILVNVGPIIDDNAPATPTDTSSNPETN